MAYTVLDSKNINKTKNIYTFGGSGTKPEREDIAENSKLIDYSSGQKFYYDPSKAAGSKWQPDKEPSGGSSGEGLPADFPAEGSANANKFAGFDENGLWTAKDAPSGGGAEKFVVNIRDQGGATSDKKVAAIVAAKEAGKDVVAKVYMSTFGVTAEIPLIYAFAAPQGQGAVVMFSAPVPFLGESIGEFIYTVYGLAATGSDDQWDSDRVSVGGSTNAPLIVTLTESEGTLTGDKTYQEVKEARLAGRPVDLVLEGYTCASVLDVSGDESSTMVTFIANGQIVTATGAPNDYVSKTI